MMDYSNSHIYAASGFRQTQLVIRVHQRLAFAFHYECGHRMIRSFRWKACDVDSPIVLCDWQKCRAAQDEHLIYFRLKP